MLILMRKRDEVIHIVSEETLTSLTINEIETNNIAIQVNDSFHWLAEGDKLKLRAENRHLADVTVLSIKSKQVSLGLEADDNVAIIRGELCEA